MIGLADLIVPGAHKVSYNLEVESMLLQIALAAAAEGPCDITGKAGNPCVAAHSTVRALYAAYDVSGSYLLTGIQ
jgi:hypothetical protein